MSNNLLDLLRRDRPVETAVHESGHLWAAHVLGLAPVAATVARAEGYLGCVWIERTEPWRNRAIMLLAGPAAHAIFVGCRPGDIANADSDYEKVRRLIEVNGGGPNELEILESEAAAFVRRNRRAIRFLAVALAESESGDLMDGTLTAALAAAQKENE